jgi:hypothetical protein
MWEVSPKRTAKSGPATMPTLLGNYTHKTG